MKTLIVAINSKYIHAALAPWYLKAACDEDCGIVEVNEYTINDLPDNVLEKIYLQKPDIVAFCCYIWNIEYVNRIADNLKKINPELQIIFGGPEVSFDSKDLILQLPFIDYIVKGEGEERFPALIKYLHTKTPKKAETNNSLLSIQENFKNDRYNIVEDLSTIKSPYTKEMLEATKGKILYFEASRGCPFSCSYCLSSTFNGVRYFPMERVKKELSLLISNGARQIKFVDRTFNAGISKAKEIIKFIAEECKDLQDPPNFHFEAAADLFDEELHAIIEKLPKGLIQLEIGIQTVNNDTLTAINRKTNTEKVFKNIKRLRDNNNVNLHLDLIAGLPYENLQSFEDSFNAVYSLQPHQLQLGFLKLLKGSQMRLEAQKHGFIFREYAPYEILSNKYITFEELVELKNIEQLVDRFYNSLRFVKSLEYIIKNFFTTPFSFYSEFANFTVVNVCFEKSVPSRDLYKILSQFMQTKTNSGELYKIKDYMKYDFLCSDASANVPSDLRSEDDISLKEWGFEFLKCEENILRYLPTFIGQSAKQIFKKVHFEKFDLADIGYVLFDYSTRDKVTNLFLNYKIG